MIRIIEQIATSHNNTILFAIDLPFLILSFTLVVFPWAILSNLNNSKLKLPDILQNIGKPTEWPFWVLKYTLYLALFILTIDILTYAGIMIRDNQVLLIDMLIIIASIINVIAGMTFLRKQRYYASWLISLITVILLFTMFWQWAISIEASPIILVIILFSMFLGMIPALISFATLPAILFFRFMTFMTYGTTKLPD